MIFGFKTVLLILYVTYVTDAIRLTSYNENTTTTTKPFRPRLRWPGSRTQYIAAITTRRPTTIVTTTAATVASPKISTVTEQVSEVDSSTKDTSRFETTLDPFSGFIQLFQPTVSHESTISVFPSDAAPHQEKTTAEENYSYQNTTSPGTAVTFGDRNSSDETETVPSIITEPFLNFSYAEEILGPVEENVPKEIQSFMPDLKLEKYFRGENITMISSSTMVPNYVVSVLRYNPENSESREHVQVYTSQPTKTQSQANASTIKNTVKDGQVLPSGTYVYVVSIVGVIPTVGMVMWCVKHVFSRPEKSKEVSKTTSYCTVDFPSGETRRENSGAIVVREADQSNKMLQTTVFQTVYSCAQYGCSNIKSSWKRMHLEYPRQNLELTEVLGEGNFGIVWKAEAIEMEEPRHRQVVAVKTVKETASYKERQELLRELQIMQLFDDHPNVVRLLGCCTETEPYFLIMEFVKNGKLQSYLRDHRSKRKYYNSTADGLNSRDLTTFAYQIANGMEYISRVGVIHRDLAARNILVDHNNVCKIADFGLSRTTEDGDNGLYEQKTKGALPIRWMAPESLYLSIFTSKSDVWAFGILLWEIVTLGSTPYPGMGAREVIHHVQKGNIMECPDHCHPDLYSVMCACWMAEPNNRPTFKSLRETLGSHLEFQAGYVDLDHFPESSFYNLYQSPGEKV